ncbi:hypothetical protein E2C01_085353 [Portunus trituberculatus]|uniref:Uncharacterized protein n=1 Tax=Portunus trituberculatus TaxID=210409 RepID=A0A5B7J2G1_PORTR|nr:hypothetical protein [Portunus trituberculatus]
MCEEALVCFLPLFPYSPPTPISPLLSLHHLSPAPPHIHASHTKAALTHAHRPGPSAPQRPCRPTPRHTMPRLATHFTTLSRDLGQEP